MATHVCEVQADSAFAGRTDSALSRIGIPGSGTFHPGDVAIEPESILRVHGYRSCEATPGAVSAAAREIALIARGAFQPIIHFRAMPVRRLDPGLITLENDVIAVGTEMAGKLAGCEAGVAFVLTLGPGSEQALRELTAAGELVEALFLETIGWLSIEASTKDFAAWTKRLAEANGYAVTRRLAPGYGSWPLTGQRSLFSLFESMPISVSLLDSCAMAPKLSRSGLYGLRRHTPLGCV